MPIVEHAGRWLLVIGRFCAGWVMSHAGWQLLCGEGLLSGSRYDSVMTAVFVILLGAYCIFRGLVTGFFEHLPPQD